MALEYSVTRVIRWIHEKTKVKMALEYSVTRVIRCIHEKTKVKMALEYSVTRVIRCIHEKTEVKTGVIRWIHDTPVTSDDSVEIAMHELTHS
jgi:hypothetical protein